MNDRSVNGGAGSPSGPRILQFGAFELRTDTGELRKHGIRVRLQMKPLQVLLALLEHPGEVVRREQLQQRLWAADTFVDFESGLNTAANRLRISLGDSADIPRFVETLPRIGYRFIAPVREISINGPGTLAAAVSSEPKKETPEVPEPAVSAPPVPISLPAPLLAPAAGRRRYSGPVVIGGATVVVLLTLLLSGHVTTLVHGQRGAEFHEIPLTSGSIAAARFAPDGQSFYYTVSGEGDWHSYLGTTQSPESRSLNIGNATVVSVSREGELALIRREPDTVDDGPILLRAPMAGGAPRETARSIMSADWAPDGQTIAAVRAIHSRFSIEYPLGTTIYQPLRWASNVRVSPDGGLVAFVEHPLITDDAGQLRVVDAHGKTVALSRSWSSIEGLAWAPAGKEVWFTASKSGSQRALYAMSLNGATRMVGNVPGALRLLDISRTGRVLIARDDDRMLMTGKLATDQHPEDLSRYDYSHADAISSDGNLLLFTESGEAGGAHYSVYLRDRAENKTTRVGSAEGLAISPDHNSVLAMDVKNPGSLILIPIHGGAQKTISGAGVRYQWATFFPDGKRLLAGGSYAGQPLHLYTQGMDGSPPEPLKTNTYLDFAVIAPDQKQVAGYALGRRLVTMSLDTFAVQDVPHSSGLLPVAWSPDGRTLVLSTLDGPVLKIVRLDPHTGASEVADTFTLPDSGTNTRAAAMVAAPSGKFWVCSYMRTASQLYVVDGWS